MEGLKLATVLGILVIVGLILVLMIRSERRERETKSQINQSLGFTPANPDRQVVVKICQLYRNIRVNRDRSDRAGYELHNVFSKRLTKGEMFIFDLVDTSGEDDSYTEKQAVAIISPRLNLPAFVIFPKADIDGAAASIANRVLGWIIAKMGNPVEFPHSPEFQQRYLVSSPDPDGTRQFLDQRKLSRFGETRLIGVHAGGDIFTLSRIDEAAKPLTQEMMSERVNQAMIVFSIFLS